MDPFGLPFSSVSCSSSAFCVAVNSYGDEISYNGSAWSTLTRIDPLGGLTAVACVAASCTAVDHFGNYLTYNGSAWSTPTLLDLLGNLNAVSCFSGSSCVAVDSNGNAFLFDVVPATAAASTTDSHTDARLPAAAHFGAPTGPPTPVASPMKPTQTSTTPTSSPVGPAPVSSPSGSAPTSSPATPGTTNLSSTAVASPMEPTQTSTTPTSSPVGPAPVSSPSARRSSSSPSAPVSSPSEMHQRRARPHPEPRTQLERYCIYVNRRHGFNDGGRQTHSRNDRITACRKRSDSTSKSAGDTAQAAMPRTHGTPWHPVPPFRPALRRWCRVRGTPRYRAPHPETDRGAAARNPPPARLRRRVMPQARASRSQPRSSESSSSLA